MPRKFFLLLIFFLPLFSRAQVSFGMEQAYRNSQPFYFSKGIYSEKDSVPADSTHHFRKKLTGPEKATIMSACVPGLGQIYNRKWWKLPIIYAGFGGLGYMFWWNNSFVQEYKHALQYRYDNNPNTIDTLSRYSDDYLVTVKNHYQHFRDLSVIGMAALYTLQVVDATVDAHMSTFDVSDDLSLQISPNIYATRQGMITSIGVKLFYR